MYTDRVLHERGWVGVAPIEHVKKRYVYIYRERERETDRDTKTEKKQFSREWLKFGWAPAVRKHSGPFRSQCENNNNNNTRRGYRVWFLELRNSYYPFDPQSSLAIRVPHVINFNSPSRRIPLSRGLITITRATEYNNIL